MSLRRVGKLAAVGLATLLWMSCGEIYRPVVIPINTTPPNPANFHAVFGISANQPFNQGTALQIDVSGDSDIGVANMGVGPTHAALLPNYSRVFVASAGSLYSGDVDVITAFTPAARGTTATGLGTPVTFTFPNLGAGQSASISSISENGNLVTVTLSAALSQAKVGAVIQISSVSVAGYVGSFLISSVNGTTITYQDSTPNLAATSGGTATIPTFCSYQPDFLTTTQNSAIYVANYGVENGLNCNLGSTDSVAVLNSTTNQMPNIVYLPAGSHPVALAETPNAQNLYVVNQGNNTITDLFPIDLSTIATIPVGNTPVWAVSRVDGNRIYVLTQGDGQLVPIDTATNTVLQSQTNLSVGAGANFILYDPDLNRLYVTNPSTGTVYVFSATGGTDPGGTPNDTPRLLATISMTAGANPPCPNGCSPVSVAALPDGSRFYVASYETAATCPDPNIGSSASCVIPRLTVFDAPSFTVKPISASLLAPSLSLVTSPQFAATQYAVPQVASCVPAATYAPGTTRFRMFATAAADSSHVYVSICDAGAIADVSTTTNTISMGSNTPDSLVTDIPSPFAACSSVSCNVAAITGFSISSNVVTFQAVNAFVTGQRVVISGLSSTAGSVLNGQSLTVLATGLSGTQFECSFSSADVGLTSDTGTAVPLPPTQSPVFLLTGQ
jgi:DNA-binding beta-propeller fold protein YncE